MLHPTPYQTLVWGPGTSSFCHIAVFLSRVKINHQTRILTNAYMLVWSFSRVMCDGGSSKKKKNLRQWLDGNSYADGVTSKYIHMYLYLYNIYMRKERRKEENWNGVWPGWCGQVWSGAPYMLRRNLLEIVVRRVITSSMQKFCLETSIRAYLHTCKY